MNPEQIFSLSNTIALLGWLLLIFAGRTRWAAPLICGVILPLVLACTYTFLLAAHWGETKGSFNTLAGVAALFSSHWLLLAGWIHYLAFDLFIGSWETRDAKANGIPHLLVLPCLLLTFFFGPVGLLLYVMMRTLRKKSIHLDAELQVTKSTCVVLDRRRDLSSCPPVRFSCSNAENFVKRDNF